MAGFFGPGDTDGGCTPCGANADSPSVSPFASPAAAEAGVAAAFSRYMSDDGSYSEYGDEYHDGVLTEAQVQAAARTAARELAGHGSPKTCVCNAGYTGDPVAGCTPCADSGKACALTRATCSHRQGRARPVPETRIMAMTRRQMSSACNICSSDCD